MNLLRKIKNFVETNYFAEKIFDSVARTYFYRKFIYSNIEKHSRFIRESKNYNIVVETTNLCNARCIMCPHSIMKRKKEVMGNELFNQVIKRLRDEKIRPLAIILNGFGDPLTDKKIFDRVRLLKKHFPDSVVKFYTNLNLANETIVKGILECGLDEINISFNGFNRKSYERTMGISYSKTLKNLERLIDERKRKESMIRIRISMALTYSNTGDETRFIKEWEKKVDSVSINKIHTYGGSMKDVSGKNKINFNKITYPCKYLWNTITIGVKGDIFLCCLDYEGTYCFGNINDKKILDIFYSQEFEKIRLLHLKGKIKEIGICKRCYTPYKNGQEWFIRDLY
jgi:radical SAM protein with 4Fe4S-binding SPASM domain